MPDDPAAARELPRCWRGTRVSEVVKTPAGKGKLAGAAQVLGGWRVRVELSSGGTWTGTADELLGAGDAETFKAFRRGLGENKQESSE